VWDLKGKRNEETEKRIKEEAWALNPSWPSLLKLGQKTTEIKS